MKNKSKLIGLIILTFIFSDLTNSQQQFSTKEATVIVSENANDTIIRAINKSVSAKLDYENGFIQFRANPGDFKTGIDSFDSKYFSFSDIIILMEGKMNIKDINTSGHPEQDLDFSANISKTNSSGSFKKKLTAVKVTGKLKHISDNNGIASCILWMSFKINPKKLKWDLPFNIADENVQVEIIQAILNKSQ